MKFDGENPILDSLFSDQSFQIKETFDSDVTSTELKVQDSLLTEAQVMHTTPHHTEPLTQTSPRLPFLIQLVFTSKNVSEVDSWQGSENATSSLANLTEDKSFISIQPFVNKVLDTTGLSVSW